MTITLSKKKKYFRDVNIVLTVFALGLLFRIIHWVFFGSNVISFIVDNNSLYFFVLKNHFFDYIYYYHTKPIGIPIFHYLTLIVFGGDSINKWSFLTISVLDSFSPAFVLLCFLRLKLPPLFSLVIVSTWSLGLITWEHWRGSGHFDHFNVFLFSFYIWAFYRSYKSASMRKNLIFGIASGLLILFSSFGPLIVLLTLILFVPRSLVNNKRLIIVRTLIPLAVFILAGGKNYFQFGIPTTSTISGQNMLQFVAAEMDHLDYLDGNLKKQNPFEEFILQNEYPEWWLWCFNSGMKNGIQTATERFVNSISGLCIYDLDKRYNFDLLEEKLRQLNEKRLLAIIHKDKITVEKKPWLFYGGITESNTRFAIEYGKISSEVWKDFIVKKPIMFITRYLKSFVLFMRGVIFLGDNKYYEPKLRSNVVRIAGFAIAPFLLVGIMSAFILVFARVIKYFLRNNELSLFLKYDDQNIMIISSIILIIYSLVINMITCCENERMFVSISPIALIIGGYYSYFIVNIVKRRYSLS